MADDTIPSMLSGLRQAGLKNRDIASATGMSRSLIWKYDNGQVARPMYDTFRRLDGLCQRVGVTVTPAVQESRGRGRR